MSQELIAKIEEKLGGVIDLITFDNTQQVVDYLGRYIQFKNLIQTSIFAFVTIICIVIGLIAFKEWKKRQWYDDACYVIVFIAVIVGVLCVISFILCLYDTIIAYNFPMVAIVEWLK